MRKENSEIISKIKIKTLELLMQKTPEQIGMRDIAAACGITAANIYHYYSDKNKLFQQIGLDCLYELNSLITKESESSKDPKQKVILAISSFRNWCFDNPKKALLVMQGIKSADDAPQEIIDQYYVCNRTGMHLLEDCISKGIAKSDNPKLDIGILVSGVWGCIESVILKKSDSEYWNDGITFTNRFIDMWINNIFGGTK